MKSSGVLTFRRGDHCHSGHRCRLIVHGTGGNLWYCSRQEYRNTVALAECMTDDGYGRKRSCSASYKAKHAK
jgi:hypothetical protein